MINVEYLLFVAHIKGVCVCVYFGHLMKRTDSLEKTLMLAKIEGGRRG